MPTLIAPLLLWLGCDGEPTPQVTLPTPPAEATLLLARHPEWVSSVSVAPRSRDGSVPDSFPPPNGWLPGEITAATATYSSPIPTMSTLTPALPEGFAILDPDGQPIRFVRDGSGGAGSWGVVQGRIQLTVPAGVNPRAYAIRDPNATERLARFNQKDSGLEGTDFVFRTERLKGTRHYGAFLPAPAEITWTVTVPKAGQLVADAALMRSPWLAENTSDGVTVVAEVIEGDAVTEVARLEVRSGQWRDLKADLSGWAGDAVSLRFRVEPGEDNREDYLMLGEPTLYTPKDNPRRIVMFFADTLRADHMGLYGYERDTSPNIDRWAGGGTVFTQARSTAPWTYPAARSILSGRMPDRWDNGPVLPELMAEAGWNTIAFTNNAYMSRFFGMDRGWSWHFYEPDFDGRAQARTLAEALKKNTDRDLLVLVQLMDVHLPYKEPEPYRGLFTDVVLDGLPDPLTRKAVLDYTGDAAVAQQYLVDRYDQSLRFMDRAIAPIFERVDDNDTIVFFSDHGEEFWEHGGFEHGHTLYDELLRVPLVIVGPDAPAGRVDAPVSTIDITPTILDIAGVPLPEGAAEGRSLLPAARQEPAALAELSARPQGFGFVLYEEDGWGVLDGTQKWITQGGALRSYDLSADPGELAPQETDTLTEAAPWQAVAGRALGREVTEAWRLVNPEDFSARPREVRLSAPSGVAAAWASLESPNIPQPDIRTEGATVVVSAAGGGVMPREIFVRLEVPGEALTVEAGGKSGAFERPADVSAADVGTVGATAVTVTVTARPGEALQTTAASVENQLRALGYLE